MYLKICGVTQVDQAVAIASMSAVNAIGLVNVPNTPRYLGISQIKQICQALSDFAVDRIGLCLNAEIDYIIELVEQTGIDGVQLHGNESANYCAELKHKLPDLVLIKALRISDRTDLLQIDSYLPWIDKLILDAYDPVVAGGTGKTIDWSILQDFQINHSHVNSKTDFQWLLAGGIKPENVAEAIAQTKPDGIDLSSGVEHKPGNKDLTKIAQLISAIRKT
jgi:phosphoribosylanthranilate isomerase